jgi:hypothetical protein
VVELVNAVEPVQDGRVYIEKIDRPFVNELKARRPVRSGSH